MTVKYRGGGHKKRYRIIDFKRDKFDISGEVKSIEYDPNRTAFISLVEYKDGEKRYIIAQNGLKLGTEYNIWRISFTRLREFSPNIKHTIRNYYFLYRVLARERSCNR